MAFYDRVLVLDQGEVAEYDTPLALLDNPDSDFRSMCEKVSSPDVVEGGGRAGQRGSGPVVVIVVIIWRWEGWC